MLLLAFALSVAFAGPEIPPDAPEAPKAKDGAKPSGDWLGEPYWDPYLRARAVMINGRTSAQITPGVEVGYRYRWLNGPPNWVGRTRAQISGMYGLNTQSIGADARIGSFIGPTYKRFVVQTGPDIFANFFGLQPSSQDYFLKPSPGIGWATTAQYRATKEISLVAGLTPSWLFAPERRVQGLGPFHELSTYIAGNVRIDGASLVLGYSRVYTAAGVQQSLILSGGL